MSPGNWASADVSFSICLPSLRSRPDVRPLLAGHIRDRCVTFFSNDWIGDDVIGLSLPLLSFE